MKLASFLSAAALLALGGPAHATELLPGEIAPTADMIAKAKKIFPPAEWMTKQDLDSVYHFRRIGSYTLVCAYGGAVGGNGGFCGQTSLSEVQKLDSIVADFCRHSFDQIVPHVVTGEAIVLNYRCAGRSRRMVRDPYASAFDPDGYNLQDWKPLE
jgi:hypothetical protein